MDSKLVVEQMSGRWKIKHPDMKPLAMEANRLAPFGTTYTWVPREQNKHADRLANEALDGKRSGVDRAGDALAATSRRVPDRGDRGARREAGRKPATRRLGAARRRADHAGPGPARRHRRTPRPSGSPAVSAATTPGSATRAGRRSGPPPTGCRRWPSGIDAVVVARRYAAPASPPRSSPRRWAAGRGGARLRRDGVRRLGRADLRRGRRAATRPSLDAWLGSLGPRAARAASRSATVEERVLAGLDRVLEAHAGQDRGRGQPRDADQDPGRQRARGAAGRRCSGWS